MAEPKKLPSGSWRVRVFLGKDKNGKKIYKSVTASSKKEARIEADRLELSFNSSCVDYNNLTLEQAYDMYIDNKSSVLSPSTIAGYKKCKRNYFKELMPFKLSKLTTVMIQNSVNALAAAHSSKTVRNAHGLLSAVLKTYYPNIQLNTTLPQRVKPSYTIPTTAEINKLLDIANDEIRIPILLASQGGLRRSEICALTLEDFNDFGVNVNKAAVYDDKNNVTVKTTKTVAGTRFVPLPKTVLEQVKTWKFFGITPNRLSHCYEKLLKKSDVPHFSFHKLRHYFASECHARGIPDKYVAEIGGWQTVEMLHDIYQHTLRDKKSVISAKIVEIFDSNFQNSFKDDTKDDTNKKQA